MSRRIRFSLYAALFLITAALLLAGMLTQGTARAEEPITITITATDSSVKPGKSTTFKYRIKCSGKIDTMTYNCYGTITGDSEHWYVLGDGTLKATSGTVTLEGAVGEEVFILITVRDKDGNQKAEYSKHVPVANIRLGKTGWVKTSKGTYYGDKNGYAVTGLQNLNGSYYYFNDDGVLQTGWLKLDSGNWYYTDENGRMLDNVQGLSEITIPAEVDQLKTSFFAYADRTFMIRCEKGSYAERFARKYGFQYSNGEKTVRGCDITDVDQKVSWVVSNYITSGMSDKEKAQVLHNWLIYNAYYDETYSHYEANGVLVLGTGVCDSYAKAYSLLLSKAGIENKRLTGQTTDSSHAWTLVRIGGQWYHTDCTWDDPIGGPKTAVSGLEGQTYFLKNDAFMLQSRSFDEDVSADANHVNFIQLNDKTYYYGTDGKRATGWTNITEQGYVLAGPMWLRAEISNWYFFDAEGVMQKGWMADGDVWYYLGQDGVMVTGRKIIDGQEYVFDEAGRWRQYEWRQLDGRWYLYNGNGAPIYGWAKVGSNWYYISGDGMVTGWNSIDGTWYYMNEAGVMQTDGWIASNGKYYLLNEDGSVHTGWAEEDGVWYYTDGNGIMMTGWQQIGGSWYYFSDSGAMQTGWTAIGSGWYLFTNNGIMQTGWVEDGDAWYWFDSSGVMATGWTEVDGRWEMFGDNGTWQYSWAQ